MDFISAVGIIAAVCTTISFLPQMIKIIKTKNTQGLSWSMYFVFTLGIFLWLVYGIFIKNIPIIAANVITLFFTSIILALKIKYK